MSSRTVHKVVLDCAEFNGRRVTGRVERWLTVQMQGGRITVWYEVDLSEPEMTTEAIFQLVGTGHPVSSSAAEYLGTVQDGTFVWHVYLIGDDSPFRGQR